MQDRHRSAKPLTMSLASRCRRKIASAFARRSRKTHPEPVEAHQEPTTESHEVPAMESHEELAMDSHEELATESHRELATESHQEPREGSGSDGFLKPFPFSRLPYDIRIIIYHYLEYDLPLAPRFECPGFYLSCQQNKNEIEEFSRDRLRSLFAKIMSASSFDIGISSDTDELRNITVTLPYTAFGDFDPSRSHPTWNREVLCRLQLLFAYPFDTLRIDISSEQCPQPSVPRYQFQDTLRSLIREIGVMIQNPEIYNFEAHSMHDARYVIKFIQPCSALEAAQFSCSTARTRRICLSWDRRPSSGSHTQLSGRLISTQQSKYNGKQRWQALWKGKPRNPLAPAGRETLVAYELYNTNYTVGEFGIASLTRWWPLHQSGKYSLTSMIGRFDLHKGIIVSSKGLGMGLENGIEGLRVRELEEEEDRRHAEAVRTDFEDKVIMACIEEGYMPD